MLVFGSQSQKISAGSVQRMRGFSLVELMITLGIAIILAAVAIPQYTNTIQTQNVTAEISQLSNDMQYARAEALKEGQMVSMCVSTNKTSCAGTTWNQGWIIYANPTSAATFTAGSSILLKVGNAFTTTDSVQTLPAPATTVVNFNRDGFAVNVSSTTGLIFTLHTSQINTAATRCLWLSSLGNMFIQKSGATAATGQGTNTCT